MCYLSWVFSEVASLLSPRGRVRFVYTVFSICKNTLHMLFLLCFWGGVPIFLRKFASFLFHNIVSEVGFKFSWKKLFLFFKFYSDVCFVCLMVNFGREWRDLTWTVIEEELQLVLIEFCKLISLSKMVAWLRYHFFLYYSLIKQFHFDLFFWFFTQSDIY